MRAAQEVEMAHRHRPPAVAPVTLFDGLCLIENPSSAQGAQPCSSDPLMAAPQSQGTVTVGTAETKAMVQKQHNRQIDEYGWHSERQPTGQATQQLPELPANQPTIITDKSSKCMNEPCRGDSEQDRPSADHPVNSLRCFLILASVHIRLLGLPSFDSVVIALK